jgi:membrane-bound metal-dependent hydrolase YbcI (DUF457 family)
MDVLTHTATAIALGMAFSRRWGRRGTLGVVIVANLPELERVVGLTNPAMLVRVAYGALHSVATLPLLGALFVLAAGRKLGSRRAAAEIAAAGLGSHIALDLVSGPGVRLLWPFARQFYGVRLLARYDLFVLLALITTLIAPALLNLVNKDLGAKPYQLYKPARAGLILVALLLVLRAGTMLNLEGRTSAALGPSALHPFAWYSVTDAGSTYNIEEVTPWREGPEFHFRKPQSNRVYEAAADTPLAQAFLEVAQFPQYSLERGEKGMLVRIRDLRFFAPGGGGKEFSVEIEVTPQLQVVAQRARL